MSPHHLSVELNSIPGQKPHPLKPSWSRAFFWIKNSVNRVILKDGVLVKLTLSTSAPFYGRTGNHVYMIINLVSIMRFVKVLGLKSPLYPVKQEERVRDQRPGASPGRVCLKSG